MTAARQPLTTTEARSQLWKAVADNKVTHIINLLTAHPELADGQLPPEATPQDGSAALGWYGRALTQIPVLSRPKEAAELYERGVGTLEALKEYGIPFRGVEEFADSLVTKKLIAAPSSPYGSWLVDKGLISHAQLIDLVLPQEDPAFKRRGPGI